MKCKKCKRKIEDNSIFCNWCGHRQLKEITEQMSVPAPKKLKNGEYSAQLMIKGQRVRIHGLNEADYYRKAKAAKAGLVEIKPKSAPYTLSDAIDKFIQAREEILSPSSIRGYRTIQRNRFQSVMNCDIHSINNWQELIQKEVKDGMSPKTVSNTWRFIQSVLKDNGISVSGIILPQKIPHEREFLEPAQITEYIAAIQDKKCELPALLALHSLRQSELLALTWEDIDLQAGTISVNGAMVPNEAHRYIVKQETKTLASRRTVPIFIPRLKELLQAVPKEERKGFLIAQHPSSIRRQLISVNEDITLHCLRHSFASLAYSLGLSELQTMELGGWSSPQTMRKVYTHLGKTDRLTATQKFEEFFNYSKITHDIQNAQ